MLKKKSLESRSRDLYYGYIERMERECERKSRCNGFLHFIRLLSNITHNKEKKISCDALYSLIANKYPGEIHDFSANKVKEVFSKYSDKSIKNKNR